MTPVERDAYVERLSNAIQTIGYARLMSLPISLKTSIQQTTDLKKKVRMLEDIVKLLKGDARWEMRSRL